MRRDLEVFAEERDGFRICGEDQLVATADPHIHLAGPQLQADGVRHPPPFEEVGTGPRLEHQPRRAIEDARDHKLAPGLPFSRRLVLHGQVTFFCLPEAVCSRCFSSSTMWSSASNRAAHIWRYRSI